VFCDKKQLISMDLAAPAFDVTGSQSFFMDIQREPILQLARHPNNNTFRAYREDMYKHTVTVSQGWVISDREVDRLFRGKIKIRSDF
jgi:hypothetical protein